MLEILYPDLCVICSAGNCPNKICPNCKKDVPLIPLEDHCALCKGSTDTITKICSSCLAHTPSWTSIACGFKFQKAGRDLLVRFKYSGHHYLLPLLVDFMEQAHQAQALPKADFIIPVPMHPLKKFLRGWNQTELLAKEFARRHPESQFIQALKRPRITRPQASLNRRQRLKASKHLFSLRNSEILKGCTILLIDDVLTTGATLNACCYALEKAGVHQINILTAARG
jgi:ComF family protein